MVEFPPLVFCDNWPLEDACGGGESSIDSNDDSCEIPEQKVLILDMKPTAESIPSGLSKSGLSDIDRVEGAEEVAGSWLDGESLCRM